MPPDSRVSDKIISCVLPTEENPFAKLSASVMWEDLGKGRRGAVLTKIDPMHGVPLVRTTTRYTTPTQHFRPVHEQLARQIQEVAALSVDFNNALIETYTNAYTTMGSHSDQALDLAADSYIAVFSCYPYPETVPPPRKLIFEPKASRGEKFQIPLAHNSIVAFSVDTNRQLKHKIILDASAQASENPWLGITFRTSKTFIRFRDGHAYLPHDTPLTTADDDQSREFYQLRRRENSELDFSYPPLTYTVSESDLMPPV